MFGAREAALPAVRTDLALTYAEIGLVLAAPQLASAVVEPVIGVLGDVWRRRTLIVGGGIAYALGLLLVAVSDGVLGLAAAFALLYPASGAFVSLSQATLMDLDPDGREHAMVRWTIWGSVGALAGPPVAAAVLFADIGWRPLFVLFAVAAVGLALAARAVPAGGGNGTVGDGFRVAVRALRRWAVLRWLVLLEAGDLLLDVFMSFLALYLVDEAGLVPGVAALAVTAWIAAGLVGNFLVLRLLRRVNGLRYLRASAVAAAALFAAFMLVPGTGAKLAAVVLLGVVTQAGTRC